MTLPDKHLRKAIFDALNGMTVNGQSIYVYDIRATNYNGNAYVLISTQTNATERDKCGFSWLSSCELQVVTRNPKNAGTRLLADDIADAVINALDGISLSVASGLKILDQSFTFPADLTNESEAEIVVQKIIRYEFRIR